MQQTTTPLFHPLFQSTTGPLLALTAMIEHARGNGISEIPYSGSNIHGDFATAKNLDFYRNSFSSLLNLTFIDEIVGDNLFSRMSNVDGRKEGAKEVLEQILDVFTERYKEILSSRGLLEDQIQRVCMTLEEARRDDRNWIPRNTHEFKIVHLIGAAVSCLKFNASPDVIELVQHLELVHDGPEDECDSYAKINFCLPIKDAVQHYTLRHLQHLRDYEHYGTLIEQLEQLTKAQNIGHVESGFRQEARTILEELISKYDFSLPVDDHDGKFDGSIINKIIVNAWNYRKMKNFNSERKEYNMVCILGKTGDGTHNGSTIAGFIRSEKNKGLFGVQTQLFETGVVYVTCFLEALKQSEANNFDGVTSTNRSIARLSIAALSGFIQDTARKFSLEMPTVRDALFSGDNKRMCIAAGFLIALQYEKLTELIDGFMEVDQTREEAHLHPKLQGLTVH